MSLGTFAPKDGARPIASTVALWLRLGAAPTFAIMALITAGVGGRAPDALCAVASDAALLSGMVPMYLLMSAFHSTPWLTLFADRAAAPSHPETRCEEKSL